MSIENSIRDAAAIASAHAMEAVVMVNPQLALLEIGNTVVRRDYTQVSQVKLVSGGAAGREPLYTGFVGRGLLTAAIQGEGFSSPSCFNILNVMKEISYKDELGVLIIIQNNSSDTLNFGLAVEKALNDNMKVRMIVVTDDSGETSTLCTYTQPKGLIGVILLQKIASAMMEENEASLNEIYEYCEETQRKIATVSFHSKCPCFKSENLISKAEHFASTFIKDVTRNLTLDDVSPFILLINNSCVSKIEESVFTRFLIQQLRALNVNIFKSYIGPFTTSAEFKGITVTLMKADDERIIKYLEWPTNAPAWNMSYQMETNLDIFIKPRIHIYKNPKPKQLGPKLTRQDSNTFLLVLQFACDALISCEKQLNLIDSECGDGDTGTRLRDVCQEILAALQENRVRLDFPYVTLKYLSRKCEGVSGTMGAVYGIIFEAAANVMQDVPDTNTVNTNIWLHCLCNSVHSLKSHTKTDEGSCTMLAPLMACAHKTEDAIIESNTLGLAAFDLGVAAAEEAARNTKLPGRKYPDSGAHSVAIWMRAVYEGVKFRCQQ